MSARHEPLRPARMSVQTAVLICAGDASWTSEVADISASGVRIVKPEQWRGAIGQRVVLDMLFDGHVDIHVEANLVRVTDAELGFTYSAIPEDRQAALWNLLGRYVDKLEPYSK